MRIMPFLMFGSGQIDGGQLIFLAVSFTFVMGVAGIALFFSSDHAQQKRGV
jgi:hypothetical protein